MKENDLIKFTYTSSFTWVRTITEEKKKHNSIYLFSYHHILRHIYNIILHNIIKKLFGDTVW